MTDPNLNTYEGLFLFNLQEINGDLNTAVQHLREILDRAEAEVIAITRWDERKLAYPIKGQKRGLFLLAAFRARPSQVANIDRDVNLSELLLRAMITRGDHLGEVELDQFRAEGQKLADQLGMEGAGEQPESTPAPAEPAAGATETAESSAHAPAEAPAQSDDEPAAEPAPSETERPS